MNLRYLGFYGHAINPINLKTIAYMPFYSYYVCLPSLSPLLVATQVRSDIVPSQQHKF